MIFLLFYKERRVTNDSFKFYNSIIICRKFLKLTAASNLTPTPIIFSVTRIASLNVGNYLYLLQAVKLKSYVATVVIQRPNYRTGSGSSLRHCKSTCPSKINNMDHVLTRVVIINYDLNRTSN